MRILIVFLFLHLPNYIGIKMMKNIESYKESWGLSHGTIFSDLIQLA